MTFALHPGLSGRRSAEKGKERLKERGKAGQVGHDEQLNFRALSRYVREVNNPNDFRYKLFPRRPAAEDRLQEFSSQQRESAWLHGMEVFLHCDPGYSPFDGDEHIICTSSGNWPLGKGQTAHAWLTLL